MAGDMAADRSHKLPAQAIGAKVETLLERGYPLSEEQISAIRFATARGARVGVIEGAAGSGKTTTLRPITDLHREHGYEIVPTAVRGARRWHWATIAMPGRSASTNS